jgi:hypothetical protein
MARRLPIRQHCIMLRVMWAEWILVVIWISGVRDTLMRMPR